MRYGVHFLVIVDVDNPDDVEEEAVLAANERLSTDNIESIEELSEVMSLGRPHLSRLIHCPAQTTVVY